MANYASVRVRVIASVESCREMYDEIVMAQVRERSEHSDRFNCHLKYVLDTSLRRTSEIEGLELDYRSYFVSLDVNDDGHLIIDLEQPWTINLGRFVNWAKLFDKNARIYYVCCEPMQGIWISNDPEFLRLNPRYEFVGDL